jgi:hypothetical protein
MLTSLPANLSRYDRRLAFARRFYEGELPEAAFIAFAEWPQDPVDGRVGPPPRPG